MNQTHLQGRPHRAASSGVGTARALAGIASVAAMVAVLSAVAIAPPVRTGGGQVDTGVVVPPPPPSVTDERVEPVPDGFGAIHAGTLEALSEGDPLVLPTWDGAGVVMRLDFRGQFPDGMRTFAFRGDPELGSDLGATAALAALDGLVGGYVRPGGGVVTRLAAIGPGMQSLHAEGTGLGCGGILTAEAMEDEGGVAGNCNDSALVQEVLVVFNGAAETVLGGELNTRAAIASALTLGNQALKNSQLNNRIFPVRVEKVTFTASGSAGTQLAALATGPAGASIRALRNQWGADLVQLITTFNDACGIAYLFNGNPDSGFSAVDAGCLGGVTSIHEFGHNFGCCHALGDGGGCDGPGYYPFSLGYRFLGASGTLRRTVMAYSPGEAIPYFSNPYVQFDGRPVGQSTAPVTDNARTIGLTCLLVSNFRCSVLGAPDCNQNQVPDPVDILNGTSLDCNLNLIPDECEPNVDCTPDEVVVLPTDSDPRYLDAFATSIEVGQRPTTDPSPYLAIGAYGDDQTAENSGAAFVWRRTGATWTQEAKLKSPTPRVNALFGWALAAFRRPAQAAPLPVVTERSFLAIGSYRQPGGTDAAPVVNQGAVYVFAQNPGEPAGTWPVIRTIRPNDSLAGALFGFAVDMTRVGLDPDDLLITGAPKSNGRGAVYTQRIPNSGTANLPNPRKLLFQFAPEGCDYGWSVAVDPLVIDPSDPNNTNRRRAVLIAGAPGYAENAGRIKVHERALSANTLFPSGLTVGLPAELSQPGERFGEAVAIADNLVAVGAPGRDNAQGAVFIFRRTGLNLYSLLQTISLGASAKPGDRFGAAVSLQVEASGSISLLIGAPRRDVTTAGGGLRIDAGSTYLHRMPLGGASFSFVREDTAFDPKAGDQFGFTVFQRPAERWIGAPFNDDQALNSGKAYFLVDPAP